MAEDHDQRFKVLLQEFFAEFFQLFFPDWARRFDFARVTWLDKEVFTDPPQGERRYLDLVARLPVLQALPMPRSDPAESWIALVHVEVESADTVAPLRRRMFEYYEHLRRQYGLPVLPVGLYLRVGLQGVGWDSYEEYFWEHRLVRFDYPYIGLPALDAEHYLRGDNWLGVALSALMRVTSERRTALGVEAWRRLVQCPENVYRRYLLCNCVEAYLLLDEAQRHDFEILLLTESDPGVRTMVTTLLDRARQEGQREGLLQGQQQLVLMLLEERFGLLSPQVYELVQALTAERLTELGRALLRAQSLRELGLEE